MYNFFLFVNVGTMDKHKLIASDKYQNAHGCKVVTSNDGLNISMDEIWK